MGLVFAGLAYNNQPNYLKARNAKASLYSCGIMVDQCPDSDMHNTLSHARDVIMKLEPYIMEQGYLPKSCAANFEPTKLEKE